MSGDGNNSSYVAGRDIRAYEKNPFVRELAKSVVPKSKTVGFAGKGSFVSQDGEAVGDMAVVGIRQAVEREKFVKMFEAGIKEAFALKPAGLGVLSVLLEAYRNGAVNSDKLYINHVVATRDYGYKRTRKTFTSGMNELLLNQFVARVEGEPGHYFINPAFFFSGDRLRIVREYVVSGTEAAENIEGGGAGEPGARETQLNLYGPSEE
jgi:hypothetical protein